MLKARGLEKCNLTQVPYQISADLSKTSDGEELADKRAYQSDVGVLQFVADATQPTIAWILSMLGRHTHNPGKSHADAIKPILRCLSLRLDDGPTYKANVSLMLTCYTDTDYAADPDTRRSMTGLFVSCRISL